ncbi:MAG: helix-turn-helix domain-containing protein [Phenylobacterium sp.]|uniref:helix-turn-helix domain-containing protein n=1 Tax=Phenylobacterium sp. TaxID=1871053 RepID=UPI001A3EC4FE|nr:helix-turn-helix domain-containing protein [Phenylobacterium sp.]MBL8770565.1 helix-turn-helix domain-containing protein [Phenylobacterium sp.]
MSEEVYTVEQFAERLSLHPKTVLRFIREGRVRAVKVGRSYRILRSDLEAMIGAHGAAPKASSIRVTSIVDIDGVEPDRAQWLARQITAARLSGRGHADPMSLDVAHDPAGRRLKVIMVGAPDDVAAMLQLLRFIGEA